MEEQNNAVINANKENNLTEITPNVIMIILLINILPVILANIGKKTSAAVPNIVIIAIYIMQVFILLFYFCKKKLKINVTTKKYIVIWSSITLILLLVQVWNYIFLTVNLQDILNILSKYVTVLTLIIFMLSAKMKKENINKIFKFLFYLGIIACLYNMIFYFNEIINIMKIQSCYSVNIKSFFANRNQFAQYLVIATISAIFLLKDENKLRYKIGILLMLVNIFFTMSRTAILAVGIFLIIDYLSNKSIKQKILIIFSIIVIVILGIVILYIMNPSLIKSINKLFIRTENLENMSGRTVIWNEAINTVDVNILLGVGRFKGIDIINDNGLDFTQFHNIFLESYVSGGLLEVSMLIYMLITLFYNLHRNTEMKKQRKTIYIASLIAFIIIGSFESCNRFSIGYVDTLFTIFFITMPILELNLSNKKNF